MAEPMTFGVELKRLREGRGVSQSELARRAGFDHSYLSRLDNGVRLPSREAVERLATALKLDDRERSDFFATAGLTRDQSGSRHANRGTLWPALTDPLLRELETVLAGEVPTRRRREVALRLRWMIDEVKREARTR